MQTKRKIVFFKDLFVLAKNAGRRILETTEYFGNFERTAWTISRVSITTGENKCRTRRRNNGTRTTWPRFAAYHFIEVN